VVVPLVYREYVVGMADEIEGETFHPVPQMTRWETLSRES